MLPRAAVLTRAPALLPVCGEERFALPPRPPSYWGLWTAPELTSGLCVFASATFKGSNRSMRVRPPASTDTWLGLSCDSTPAEYFQAPIQGGKPRFLAHRRSVCSRYVYVNCGQVG